MVNYLQNDILFWIVQVTYVQNGCEVVFPGAVRNLFYNKVRFLVRSLSVV